MRPVSRAAPAVERPATRRYGCRRRKIRLCCPMRSRAPRRRRSHRPDEHEEAGDDSGCTKRTGRMPYTRDGRRRPAAARARVGQARTGRRSCSSTAGRRTTSAGRSSTRARSPTSSGSSPTTCAATACPRRRSSPSTTPTASSGPTTWRRSSTELRLDRPVLVGWSYGAFVICDYVRTHGQERIAAIDFVEGAVKLGEAAFGTLIGPGFLDHFADATADDLPTNIWAMRAFVRACVAKPLVGRRARDGAVLEHRRAGARPRQSRARARSTTTTCCARSRCRCSSRTAGRTRSCCRRWPSTSSPPARPPRPPGTTASVTCRTWRSPSASTASWPR